jgi:hypothetical protein
MPLRVSINFTARDVSESHVFLLGRQFFKIIEYTAFFVKLLLAKTDNDVEEPVLETATYSCPSENGSLFKFNPALLKVCP